MKGPVAIAVASPDTGGANRPVVIEETQLECDRRWILQQEVNSPSDDEPDLYAVRVCAPEFTGTQALSVLLKHHRQIRRLAHRLRAMSRLPSRREQLVQLGPESPGVES